MSVRIQQRGFTIVELLIVIVVIAILAAIVIVAYNGVQARARDSRRVSDVNAIVKALELYKIQNGSYPAANGANAIFSWEVSSINPDQFLSALKTSGTINGNVPVDPVNDGTTLNSHLYRYYRYGAAEWGCPGARGDYYVLIVGKADSTSGQLSSSPGFSCTGRDWSTDGGYVTGNFTN